MTVAVVMQPDNKIINVVGNPSVVDSAINYAALETITQINPNTHYILVYDPSATGEKLKKITPAALIDALQIITL